MPRLCRAFSTGPDADRSSADGALERALGRSREVSKRVASLLREATLFDTSESGPRLDG